MSNFLLLPVDAQNQPLETCRVCRKRVGEIIVVRVPYRWRFFKLKSSRSALMLIFLFLYLYIIIARGRRRGSKGVDEPYTIDRREDFETALSLNEKRSQNLKQQVESRKYI